MQKVHFRLKCVAQKRRSLSSLIPVTDVIQLTLTLQLTTAQAVETSVGVNNNSPIQDYVQPDDKTQPTFEMTPGLKPFTVHFQSNFQSTSLVRRKKERYLDLRG